MTDRYHSLTVVLEQDIRDDEAERLMDAISIMKGVLGVAGNVVDSAAYTAHLRVTRNVTEKLHAFIKELNSL